MNITSPFTQQVRDEAGHWTAESFERIVAGILASYHREHDPVTDHHGTIQAIGSITERGRTTPQGVSVDVPYGATTFSGSGGMTWTVPSAAANYAVFAWSMVGMRMFIDFSFINTSVTAPLGTVLSFTIPNLAVAKRTTRHTFWYRDNGTPDIGLLRILKDGTTIDLFTKTLVAWTASVNGTDIVGKVDFEINP
jgi:hypothetical protein